MRLVRLKPQGPALNARYNENLQSWIRAALGLKIYAENLQFSKIFAKRYLDPSSRSAAIHPATNQPIKNK